MDFKSVYFADKVKSIMCFELGFAFFSCSFRQIECEQTRACARALLAAKLACQPLANSCFTIYITILIIYTHTCTNTQIYHNHHNATDDLGGFRYRRLEEQSVWFNTRQVSLASDWLNKPSEWNGWQASMKLS